MGPQVRAGRIALALLVVVAVRNCNVAAGSEREVAPHAGRAEAREAVVVATPAPDAVSGQIVVSTPAASAVPPAKAAARKLARPTGPRAHVVVPTRPFARVGSIALVHPAARVERVGFHQASDIRNREMHPVHTAVRGKVLPTRHRPTSSLSAVDVVVDPRAGIRAPVTGIVKRAGNYRLYCKHPDSFVVISPAGHPELEVKMLHIRGLRVKVGDRVTAGLTKVAKHSTKFPFGSQIDAFTARPAWPHVHMEVTKLEVPSAVPQPGQSLVFGC